jgi:type IX secretion system PorP/SprF family membrane protein
MKKLIAILSIGIGIGGYAQDVHFSQFTLTPLQINPAQTGMIPANFRANLGYRSQWGSVTTPYKTYYFSGDMSLAASKMVDIGFGLNVYRDMAGDTKFGTTLANMSVSAIVKLDRNQEISAGIMGGILQKAMSGSNLMWDSQYQNGSYDPALPGEALNLTPAIMPDVSAGVVYHYHVNEGYMTANDMFQAKVGVSYNHINRPKMKFFDSDTLYSNFIAFADLQIGLGNSRWSLVPGVLAMFQGPSKEISVGNLFKFRLQEAAKITGLIKGAYLYAGAYYRVRDAVAAVVMVEFDQYTLGMSYDINISPLVPASNMQGGPEIIFRFMTPNPYLYKGTKASFR